MSDLVEDGYKREMEALVEEILSLFGGRSIPTVLDTVSSVTVSACMTCRNVVRDAEGDEMIRESMRRLARHLTQLAACSKEDALLLSADLFQRL